MINGQGQSQREGEYEMGNNRHGGYAQGNSGRGGYRGSKGRNSGPRGGGSKYGNRGTGGAGGKSSSSATVPQLILVWSLLAAPIVGVLSFAGYVLHGHGVLG